MEPDIDKKLNAIDIHSNLNNRISPAHITSDDKWRSKLMFDGVGCAVYDTPYLIEQKKLNYIFMNYGGSFSSPGHWAGENLSLADIISFRRGGGELEGCDFSNMEGD